LRQVFGACLGVAGESAEAPKMKGENKRKKIRLNFRGGGGGRKL
jgi:hypothetical protein